MSQFSSSAQWALEMARAEAPLFHHDFIGTEHVLLGLLKSPDGKVGRVLHALGVNHEAVRHEIEKIVGTGPLHETQPVIPFTPRARQALHLATNEAKAFNRECADPEHILLGLLLEGGGVAALVLKKLGVEPEMARQQVLKELGRGEC